MGTEQDAYVPPACPARGCPMRLRQRRTERGWEWDAPLGEYGDVRAVNSRKAGEVEAREQEALDNW